MQRAALAPCCLFIALVLLGQAPSASAAGATAAQRRTGAAAAAVAAPKLVLPTTPRGTTTVVGRLARLSGGAHSWVLHPTKPANLKGMQLTLQLPAHVHLPAAWKAGADATLRGTHRLVGGWPSAFAVSTVVKVSPRFGAAAVLYEPGLKSVTAYLVTACGVTQTKSNGQQPTAAVRRGEGAASWCIAKVRTFAHTHSPANPPTHPPTRTHAGPHRHLLYRLRQRTRLVAALLVWAAGPECICIYLCGHARPRVLPGSHVSCKGSSGAGWCRALAQLQQTSAPPSPPFTPCPSPAQLHKLQLGSECRHLVRRTDWRHRGHPIHCTAHRGRVRLGRHGLCAWNKLVVPFLGLHVRPIPRGARGGAQPGNGPLWVQRRRIRRLVLAHEWVVPLGPVLRLAPAGLPRL